MNIEEFDDDIAKLLAERKTRESKEPPTGDEGQGDPLSECLQVFVWILAVVIATFAGIALIWRLGKLASGWLR